jgi:hypothetical protein
MGGDDCETLIGECRPLNGRGQHKENEFMAIRTTRSAGMLLLGIWLILTGITGFANLPIPEVLMAALALIAGVLVLIGI